MPTPYQKPFPELRVAVNSPDTFAAVGALGYPIFAAVNRNAVGAGAEYPAYRAAYRGSRAPGHGKVYLRLPVDIADTYKRARDEAEESVMHFYRWLGDQLEASASQAGAAPSSSAGSAASACQTMTYSAALRDKVVVGAPAEVTGRLMELRDELGLDDILAEINCGSLIPHQQVMRALKLLCAEVMPAFK